MVKELEGERTFALLVVPLHSEEALLPSIDTIYTHKMMVNMITKLWSICGDSKAGLAELEGRMGKMR
jgi:hypothetical protein